MIKLTPNQLDSKWDFVKRYMGHGNNATLSEVDPNSNISHKNVATLEGEFHKDVMVQVNRHILGQKIKEMFGKKAMKQYYRDLKDHIIYKNDETSLKPYCVAISLTPFIVNGMRGIGGESRAPEHLASFCGSYINLMYAIASQFAGAVADVSFLTYFHYFAKRDFGADYLRTHTDLIKNYFQQVIYSLNMPSGSRSYQSIFYNTSVFDREYFDALFGETLYPDGTNPAYDEVHELQKFFMEWFGEERHKAILTFPVLTAAYLSEGDHAKDTEFQEFLASQMEKGHSFFHYHSPTVDSLSSCCRLRNAIDFNQFSYSLGGTGVMSGSVSVITLNINKIIQKGIPLDQKVREVHQYLVAYKALMYDFQKAGLMPAYDEGYISLDKQYITIGLNGVVEAAEWCGFEISDNAPYKSFLKKLFGVISKENQAAVALYEPILGHKLLINTELIPAEGVGVKFAKWNKKAGIVANRDCYNSYLYRVEDDSLNIFDKFAMHGGDVLKYLDGGSAVHLNLDEIPTKDTWVKVMNAAIKAGSNYWTWNVKSTYCEECGHINMHTTSACVKCGSTNISYLTRIIGYLKKISSFSQARQVEAAQRYYHKEQK